MDMNLYTQRLDQFNRLSVTLEKILDLGVDPVTIQAELVSLNHEIVKLQLSEEDLDLQQLYVEAASRVFTLSRWEQQQYQWHQDERSSAVRDLAVAARNYLLEALVESIM